MPVIRSAKKKMRKDLKITVRNDKHKQTVKKLIRLAKKNPTVENLKKAQSAIDKLAKINIIHKNKAGRLKSKLLKSVKKAGSLEKPAQQKNTKTRSRKGSKKKK